MNSRRLVSDDGREGVRMSRPVTWLLTKAGLKVCCELSDADYQALPSVTLNGLLSRGIVVTRIVPVPLAEFVEIGGLQRASK